MEMHFPTSTPLSSHIFFLCICLDFREGVQFSLERFTPAAKLNSPIPAIFRGVSPQHVLLKRLTARNDPRIPQPIATRCVGGSSYESPTLSAGVSWAHFSLYVHVRVCSFCYRFVPPPVLVSLFILTALEL